MIFVRPSEIRCAAPCPGGRKSCVQPLLKVSGGVEKHRGQGERNFKLWAPYLSLRDMRDIQIRYKIGLVMRQKVTTSLSSHSLLLGVFNTTPLHPALCIFLPHLGKIWCAPCPRGRKSCVRGQKHVRENHLVWRSVEGGASGQSANLGGAEGRFPALV